MSMAEVDAAAARAVLRPGLSGIDLDDPVAEAVLAAVVAAGWRPSGGAPTGEAGGGEATVRSADAAAGDPLFEASPP